MIFASHFSFGSGGGVPAIGCGLGLVTLICSWNVAAVFDVVRLAKTEWRKKLIIIYRLHSIDVNRNNFTVQNAHRYCVYYSIECDSKR